MSSDLKAHLKRGASGTLALKVTAAGLTFATSVLLARALGKAGMGAYAYGIAWLGVLSFPLGLGLDQLLVRKTAAWRLDGAWELARGLLRRSVQFVLLGAFGLSALTILAVRRLGWPADDAMRTALIVALALLPVIGLLRICESTLRGLQVIPRAYLPEMLVRPLGFALLVGGCFLYGLLDRPWLAVALNGSAAALALLFGLLLLRLSMPPQMRTTPAVTRTREWLRAAWPLWLISMVVVVNAQADLIMLGSMRAADQTGVYAVAARGAGLVNYVLVAVNGVLGPTVAALYAAGETERLQRVLTRSARVVLGLTAPLALALILGGHWFLLLFGEGFTAGRTALTVLCAGQIVNAGMGSVGLVLIMTGHDWEALAGLALGAGLNILLNALLIPRYGILGAASATAASMICWNLVLALRVRRRLSLDSTALGRPPA